MVLRHFLTDLRANLRAGARLALLQRVSLLDFRVSVGQLLTLAAFGGLCASLVDLSVLTRAAEFNPAGIGGHIRDTAILLLLCWAVALGFRAPGAALALPVAMLAAGWLPDVTFAFVVAGESLLGFKSPTLSGLLWWIVLLWSWIVAWRSVAVALQGSGRFSAPTRAVAVFVLFGGMVALALLFPSPRLWQEATVDDKDDGEGLPRIESEEAMTAQPRLLFEALTNLEPRESGTTNTYFIGFAGDASQDVFRNDMEAAQEVVDARLGTAGRSLTLINSRKTVLDTPIATVGNLQAALSTVGRLIDADEDIAVLYLSSHGSPNHQLFVNFPPLILQQLTPAALQRMLQDAKIKWRVIIVSSCYSGGYVEPLKDPYTLVITASRADRTSFGCENHADFTYFGQAYFQEALRRTTSMVDAFEIAKNSIAERERAEGLTPSEPQMYLGSAIRDKLGAKGRVGRIALTN